MQWSSGKTNGLLCGSLSKLVDTNKRKWDVHVSEVLWAYRTTHKLSLGFTPFQLVYGVEAILPIELEITSLRTSFSRMCNKEETHAQRLVQLETLDEKRLQALQHLEATQQRRKARYDALIKKKKKPELKEGSLVMKYDGRVEKRLDKKLLRRWEGPFSVKKKFKNNTYLLEDANGQEVPGRANEYRLKVFYPRIPWPADPHAMHGDLLGGERCDTKK